MAFKTLKLEVANRIATLTLNRPDAANGMNLELTQELAVAAAQLDADGEVKAVIVTAEGRFFSAGGDLKSMSSDDPDFNPGVYIKDVADYLHKALSIFARMEAPVIVAVNGMAAGAGFSFSLAGDMAIAAKSAAFTMAYTAAGLSPDGGSTYTLPRLIGERRAKELMLTNKMLSAQDALEWGLINAVVEDDQLMQEANKLAAMFVSGSKRAFGDVKTLLLSSDSTSFEAQMEIESRTIRNALLSEDGVEGTTAFVEKRKPQFK